MCAGILKLFDVWRSLGRPGHGRDKFLWRHAQWEGKKNQVYAVYDFFFQRKKWKTYACSSMASQRLRLRQSSLRLSTRGLSTLGLSRPRFFPLSLQFFDEILWLITFLILSFLLRPLVDYFYIYEEATWEAISRQARDQSNSKKSASSSASQSPSRLDFPGASNPSAC